MLDDLRAHLFEALDELARLVPVPDVPAPDAAGEALDLEALKTGFAELETLLRQSNMRSTKRVQALRQQGASALGPAFGALCDATAALDFATALVHCQTLMRAHPLAGNT
jgi:hypothetical protein